MQVLAANSKRLVPAYTQQCKREWGIEGTAFDVSFIVPGAHPYALLQTGDATCVTLAVRGQCSSCGQPAAAKCSRCQVERPATLYTRRPQRLLGMRHESSMRLSIMKMPSKNLCV